MGCDVVFNDGFARRLARRYRRRGLDRTARRMIAFLASEGVTGATVLEIGGGVGEIQIELLERGAVHATNLELSTGYDEPARRLLSEHGLTQRVVRRIHDIAADPAGVEPADVVVLHRVICCYPDYDRLLGAAGDHARRLLVFSYPADNAIIRLGLWTTRQMLRLSRREYRPYLHPPRAMRRVLVERGFQPAYEHNGFGWHVLGLVRA
jgi:Methyltransferase domain